MAKFNTRTTPTSPRGPVVSEPFPSARTYEGGAGYARDAKSELYLLGVSNMVGESTFYESDRDDRFQRLVRQTACEDPQWTGAFLHWLRTTANLRSAPLVGAAEFVRARREADLEGYSRQVVSSVLRRADEPGELISYWMSHYGRALPQPLKRGIADSLRRVYTPYALVKWDSDARRVRFGDVIELTHPRPADAEQGALFAHAIDRRHGRGEDVPKGLPLLGNRAELMRLPVSERRPWLVGDRSASRQMLRDAGMTWESIAGWLQGPMDSAAWEAIIPSMGYMALLRNLRNFDQAGVGDAVASEVAAKLAAPDQVARSGQLPLRFLSAYRATENLRWSWPLEQALNTSLNNIPSLPGRTLILVDTSASMRDRFSRDGTLMRWDAATLFGLALAHRCERADVFSYSGGGFVRNWLRRFDVKPTESLLLALRRWQEGGFFLDAGTDTRGAVEATFEGHDRVVILTDEQHSDGDVGAVVPKRVPLYTWNLAGYRYGHAVSAPRRYAFGGLNDASLTIIPLLEAGEDARWPWELLRA